MTLPKLTFPIFEVNVPSTSKTVKIRPMLAREEKILLMAKEGQDDNEILGAVKQVVHNCIVADKSIVDPPLTVFDLQYLFIKIQARSVNNIVKLSYRDNEDDKVRQFDVDLDKVEVKFPEKDESVIPISDTVSLKLKYPSENLYSDASFLKLTGEKIVEELLARSIHEINDGATTLDPKLQSQKELRGWLDELPVAAYTKIKAFFDNTPKLNYTITYTNDKGNQRNITLSSLNDFFTLR